MLSCNISGLSPIQQSPVFFYTKVGTLVLTRGFAGQDGEPGPAEQPEGPFEVTLQYNGPAVLLWLWSNAHSSENTGLKAQPIKHIAGNSGALAINLSNPGLS